MDPNMRPRSGVKRERKCVSRAERIWRGDQSVFEVLRSQSEFGEKEKEELKVLAMEWVRHTRIDRAIAAL